MINFLRRIRRNLATENKLTLYLIYAIGEVVLVVLGILIALQIDNWNESRKAVDIELQLYIKILDDLNDQYKSTIGKIDEMKTYQDVHFHVYQETRGKANYDSTMYYNSLQWVLTYHPEFSEKYTDISVTIKNDNIRSLIKRYISSEKATSDAYQEWNEFKEQRFRPFLNKYGIHNTEAAFNVEPYDFLTFNSIDLLDHSKLQAQFGTTELDELLFDLRFKTSWIFNNLNWLKIRNNVLESALLNELNSNKQVENIKRIRRPSLSELLEDGKSIDEISEMLARDNQSKTVYLDSEDEINNLGYTLLRQGRYRDALKIFMLNTELYPYGYNTHDSYGECLLIIGDTANAIKAYKKSLELNPGNTYAKDVLNSVQ